MAEATRPTSSRQQTKGSGYGRRREDGAARSAEGRRRWSAYGRQAGVDSTRAIQVSTGRATFFFVACPQRAGAQTSIDWSARGRRPVSERWVRAPYLFAAVSRPTTTTHTHARSHPGNIVYRPSDPLYPYPSRVPKRRFLTNGTPAR